MRRLAAPILCMNLEVDSLCEVESLETLVSSMAKSENSSLRISGDEQFEHMLNSLIGLVESGFDLAVGLESFVRPVMEQ
jgi:predicted transcriptional regulator YheO